MQLGDQQAFLLDLSGKDMETVTCLLLYGKGNVAVIVEDCVSASVLDSEGCVGVALLGTSLSQHHREYLKQFSTVIIALDPDASNKSFAMAKELRGCVNKVLVLKLEDDLKYKKENDLIKN